MNRLIFAFSLIFACLAGAQEDLRPALESTYNAWRGAILRRDATTWERVTAEHRRVEIQNRIVSEKRGFPSSVFELPAPPPSLEGLKFLQAKQKGPTAKASYFGRIDFGVEGKPLENLIVLSFVKGKGGWLYDRADFVSLLSLPDVRQELAAGNLKYLEETPEAQPSGQVPPTPIAANTAKYIAKVYVFCPGREVKVQINKISRHRFANVKESEVVIGGAKDGQNEVQFAIQKLEGGKGNEALTIRVYLMSEIQGVQPIKVCEYQASEGQPVKDYGTVMFNVDAATVAKLQGR